MIAVDRKAPKPLLRQIFPRIVATLIGAKAVSDNANTAAAAIFVTALQNTAASNNENNRIVMSIRQASKTMHLLVTDLQMARLLTLVLKLTAIALSLRLPFHSSGR